MEPLALQLLGLGAVTPLGLSAPSTCAALRAQLSAYALSPMVHEAFIPAPAPPGTRLEPIKMARLSEAFAPDELDDVARLLRIAAAAVEEALMQAGVAPCDCALIVGTREPQREHPDLDDFGDGWIRGIEDLLGLNFQAESTVIARGHVSALAGVRHAQALLRDRRVESCIVGGVDSLCNVYDLERYLLAYRILGSTVSQGFVPGEGAAFVALGRADPAAAIPVRIAGVGLASEAHANCLLGDGPATGRGLQRALDDAVAQSGIAEGEVRLRVSDLNGESFRIDDSLFASVRFYKTYRRHLELWHPAGGVGDMGAASGGMLLVQGCTALMRGLAPGLVAMCESSSDATDRAACVLVRVDGGRGPLAAGST